MAVISPKAIVENPAGLADDVRVGPFSYVGPQVTIGEGTVVHNGVTVLGATAIGSQCELFPGCVVGSPPTGAEGGPAACTVGDRNIIREHVTVEGGTGPAPGTQLGDDNLLMVGCHVAHDAVLAGQALLANFTRIGANACIEPYVRTSGFTVAEAHVTVGAYTFTTGYASVEQDMPPFAIVQGLPSAARGVNVENLRRCGFDAETIGSLQRAFRMLFDGRAALPDPRRLGEVAGKFDNPHVRHLVECLQRSAASPTGRRRQSPD